MQSIANCCKACSGRFEYYVQSIFVDECENCGAPTQSIGISMKLCAKCSMELNICPVCGESLELLNDA